MTPERFKHIKEFRLMYGEVSCTATAELIEEIERLQRELADYKEAICINVDIIKGRQEEIERLRVELEQAKEHVRQWERVGDKMDRGIKEIETDFNHEFDERSKLLKENARLLVENEQMKYYIGYHDIEGLKRDNTRLREALTPFANVDNWDIFDSTLMRHAFWIRKDANGNYETRPWKQAEASIAVPPAPVRRTEEERERDKAEMRKVSLEGLGLTVPPAPPDEREAWLDGRARVEPEKEKP